MDLRSFNAPFPGSYRSEDCLFLLKAIPGRHTPIEEKERLIQSGRKHYSEMISVEEAPGPEYTALFLELTERYKTRLAQEVLTLAELIRQRRPEPITLVSLARAGTPIGALLQRALTRHLGVQSRHYSISIIRDRGIDQRALRYMLQQEKRSSAGVVFVDGWTAKGVITRELKQAVQHWNQTQQESLSDELFVISDIGGTADVAATFEDYVIPSGIMNATVSGLVSRSVLNEQIGPKDFHGCVVYEHLRALDRSRWFLDQISEQMARYQPGSLPVLSRHQRMAQTHAYLQHLQTNYRISDINRIKPGIAEATRVMLRRVPDTLLLVDPESPDVAHLKMLAREKKVAIHIEPQMPFKATALIRDIQKSTRPTGAASCMD